MQVRALASGSSGNCYLVKTERTKILVDVGLSSRAVLERLHFCGENPAGLDAILISHEHTDHTKGVPVLSRRLDAKVYANAPTYEGMGAAREKIAICRQHCFVTGRGFEIGDIWVETFCISHDSMEPVGFIFYHEGSRTKIGIATDLGEVTCTVEKALYNCHLLIIETNHDLRMLWEGAYPYYLKQRIAGRCGHLSNQAGAELIRKSVGPRTKAVWLAHLSKENNRPHLAYREVFQTLLKAGIQPEKDVQLSVIHRETIGPLFE